MRKEILLVGGGGYIGAHVALELESRGHRVLILDNFSNTRPDFVSSLESKMIGFTYHDATSLSSLESLFIRKKFDTIIHFAAFKSVPDSVASPDLYYRNNLNSLTNILEIAVKKGVKNFIYSSSCSVYGNSIGDNYQVTEETALGEALSPYAHTKQIGEKILETVANLRNIKAVSLRYFNPAGSHHTLETGENNLHNGSLFSSMCQSAILGIPFNVFGTDYDTRDGSCIRDYIHIEDLAKAHVDAIDYLKESEDNYDVINIGTGTGQTVLECLESFQRVNGIELDVRLEARRPGDIPALYASIDKAEKKMRWKPTKSLDEISKSHFQWFQKNSELLKQWA